MNYFHVSLLQLLSISSVDLIAYGNSYFSSRLIDAKKALKLNKAFKIKLGRGLYGECLVIVSVLHQNPRYFEKILIESELDFVLCIGNSRRWLPSTKR